MRVLKDWPVPPMRSSAVSLLIGLILLPVLPTSAVSQDLAEIGTLIREEKPALISEPIYRRLEAAHELYADGEIDQTLERLVNLQEQRLTPYEAALVEQTFGYCYMQLGDVGRATVAFERSLELDGLQNLAQQQLRYSLASLYAAEGQFENTIERMRIWFSYAEEPVAADALMLVGSSYAQLADFVNALPYVGEAIRRSAEPNESWYTLKLSIYFELMDYTNAAIHLRDMVLLWPDNAAYWDLLAGAYLELQDDGNALATLMVAYENGLVEEEAKLLNLVRLNLFLDVPYEAGVMLESELADGRISESQEILELLLTAWTNAREFDSAIAVIDRLAPLANDGSYYLRKAKLLSEQARWVGVIEAANQALVLGGLEDPGDTLVLRGLAQAELGRYEEALVTFEEAAVLESATVTGAAAWSDYVRDRQQAVASQR